MKEEDDFERLRSISYPLGGIALLAHLPELLYLMPPYMKVKMHSRSPEVTVVQRKGYHPVRGTLLPKQPFVAGCGETIFQEMIEMSE